VTIALSAVLSPGVTLDVRAAALPQAAGGIGLCFKLFDGPLTFTLTAQEAHELLEQIRQQLTTDDHTNAGECPAVTEWRSDRPGAWNRGDRDVARLSENSRGQTSSCAEMTRSRCCVGSFRSRKLRRGPLPRSCEVAPNRCCHFRTTARNSPTASRRCDSGGSGGSLMNAIVR
jgi:hypothetical protein